MGETTKGPKPKRGQAGKETHQKKSCRWSEVPFQMYMVGKKTLKERVHLIKKLIEFSSRSANFVIDLLT